MPSTVKITPFTMVLSAIWELLLDHPCFFRDVREGNRIRFDSQKDRDPLKSTIGAADLPEVSVVSQTVSANIQNTSSSSMCIRRYSILVSTGDYRYSEILGVIEWYIFVAMVGWQTRLTRLKWQDKAFCKRLNVVSATTGLSDPAQNRNIVGWSAVWQIEVEMHFATADLLAELRGENNGNS